MTPRKSSMQGRLHPRLLLLATTLALLAAWPVRAPAQTPDTEVSAELGMTSTTLYVGQQAPLMLTIRARGITLGKQFQLDNLNPGSPLALGTFQELPASRENAGDQLIEIRRFRCNAQALQPGAVELAPMLRFQQVTQERTFWGVTSMQVVRSLPVRPLTITVNPLPTAGRPPDFSGAIGAFTFTMDATPRDVAIGDLVTLTLTISGNGRLDGLPCPPLAPAPHFKIYPPKLAATEPGSLRFEQIVIPQDTNAVATPSAHFTFFDATSGAYRTLTAGPVPLRYHARSAAPAFTPYRPPTASAPPIEVSPSAATATVATADETADAVPSASAWRGAARALPWPILAAVGAALGLLMAAALAALALWRRHKRTPAPQLWRSALVCAVAGILALAASRHLARSAAAGLLERTVARAVPARIAPSQQARELTTFEPGTRVVITETWNHWLCVVQPDTTTRGWIPSDALESAPPAGPR